MTTASNNYFGDGTRPEKIHSGNILLHLTVLGITIHAALIPMFEWLGVRPMALINIASTAAWLLARRFVISERPLIASYLIITEVYLHAVLSVHFIGWQSGFQYYLLPLIVLILFLDVIHDRLSLVLVGITAITYLVLKNHGGGIVTVSDEIIALLSHANMTLTLIALIIIGYYYRKSTHVYQHRLTTMARTDPLTGLLNRRGAQELIDNHIRFCNGHDSRLTLVLADIDHFKALNDEYGHACGDRILESVSNILTGELRQSDIVARWGGEEFLLLLPGTDSRSASEICEKLRQRIEAHRVICQDRPIRCSLTFGIAEYRPGRQIEAVIATADRMLYAGKAAGRNRVMASA